MANARTVFIYDLSPRLVLAAPIPIVLDFGDDLVTARCFELDFGVGPDEDSALADLKASVIELYFLLKAESNRLGPLPQRQWNYLQSVVRETL